MVVHLEGDALVHADVQLHCRPGSAAGCSSRPVSEQALHAAPDSLRHAHPQKMEANIGC